MKTICILIFVLMVSAPKYKSREQRELNVSEILANWKHKQNRVNVKISKVEVDVAEMSLNQKILKDAEN